MTDALSKKEFRLLRFLAKKPAILEVPPRNAAIESIVQKGLATWKGRFEERWNYRMHQCSTLYITDDGRKALEQTNAN